MRSATTTYPGHPSSVPTARRWVVATLAAWGLDDTAWTAAQVVSELATNCTLHARSDFTIRVAVDSGCVRLEAEDDSPIPLQSRAAYSSTATTGRGLGIVSRLSTEWGVTAKDPGKTVWALLAVEGADLQGAEDERSEHQAARTGPGAGSAPAGTRAAVAGRSVAA